MSPSPRTWPSRLLARPWLLVFVPVNAATSGFGVVLPLLILITLHGRWVDVALAASLFNAAVIVASFFWGYISDRYPARRAMLLINFAGFALIYATLAWSSSLALLFVLYTLVGFIAPAGTSASNLLILEKFSETERPTAYASFQEMSILGSMGGLLAGYFWLLSSGRLEPLLLVLAGLAGASAIGVYVGVRNPSATNRLRIANVGHHPESLLSRLRVSSALHIMIPFFPTRPRVSSDVVRRFRRWARAELHHELPLILAAVFLFNLSSNLFNISYTPFLYSLGIGAASIFLVNFSNNTAQGILYPFSGGLTSRSGADSVVQRSAYIRSLGYLAVAAFTFIPLATGTAFGSNLIAFGVLGGAIALYSTSSSMILFRGLEGRDAGSLLGVNSALGGVAAVLGAVLSGVLSVWGSYRIVFLISGGALLISIPLWAAAHIAYLRRKSGSPSPESARPAGKPGPASQVP